MRRALQRNEGRQCAADRGSYQVKYAYLERVRILAAPGQRCSLLVNWPAMRSCPLVSISKSCTKLYKLLQFFSSRRLRQDVDHAGPRAGSISRGTWVARDVGTERNKREDVRREAVRWFSNWERGNKSVRVREKKTIGRMIARAAEPDDAKRWITQSTR